MSDEAYYLLLLNVVSFAVGFMAVKVDSLRNNHIINIEKTINNKWLKMVVVTGIIIVFFLVIIKQQALSYSDDDYAGFRADFFELMFADNILLLYVYYLFLYPLYYYLSAVIAHMLFFYRKWNLIILFLLYVGPFMTLGEGRSQYMILGLIIILNYILYRTKGGTAKIKLKHIMLVMITFVAIYISMANVTAHRQHSSIEEGAKSLNETFVVYSVSPFRAFDYALEHDYVNIAGGYQYGRASFCGFDYLVASFMKRFGIYFQSSREVTNSYLQNTQVPIGIDKSINYSYTNAIYHYYDFGMLGIILFPFLFGLFCRYVIKKMYEDGSLSLIALLSFIYFIAMHMVFSWYFNKLFTLPYILLLLYLNKRRKLRKRNLSI